VQVTHAIGDYRLVFKQGEPFKPVALRVHGDPISIIGKVLDQNRRSYTKINEFVGIGQSMVSEWFKWHEQFTGFQAFSLAERLLVALESALAPIFHFH
jgi:hypothetical protein